MDIDMISGLITCLVACACWLLWLVGYIVDRQNHKRKVIAEQNKAIERVRRRDAQAQRNRNITIFEGYCYGVGIDTTKL